MLAVDERLTSAGFEPLTRPLEGYEDKIQIPTILDGLYGLTDQSPVSTRVSGSIVCVQKKNTSIVSGSIVSVPSIYSSSSGPIYLQQQ